MFVELYREGLIYKDKRLVNWDPKLLTAISDLEVMQVETKGHLWHLRYPIEGKTFDPDDPSTYIVVATTRPETMLGDTAVAVHPDDERYKHLVGKNVILPLVGRKIPIIADDYSDPEKGSGAVKITPAHDFNDFEVGKRHELPQINVFDVEGKITLEINEDFYARTVDRCGRTATATISLRRRRPLRGAQAIVARLEEQGPGREDRAAHARRAARRPLQRGDRAVPTDQWYVNAKELAKPAIAAVRDGKTKFVPKNWENDLFQLDGEHPAVVHLAPALVGPPNSGVVWRRRTGINGSENLLRQEQLSRAQVYGSREVRRRRQWHYGQA